MKRSITLKLLPYILPVLLLATISSCKKEHNIKIAPAGKYEDGFFIVNEGNYGHGNGGTITYFDYKTGTLTDSTYTKENAGKTFDPNTSSLEFGTVYNNKIYLLTKSGGPLVVADASTLKETGRIAAASSNDWRAFLGIDANNGLVSTVDGVYPINLQTVTLGTKISGTDGEVGDMIKAGNYIFLMSQVQDGVIVLNASDYSVVKTIPGLEVGFAKSIDGTVWAAGYNTLAQIDPATLAVNSINVPFNVNGSWGAWHVGSIAASTTDNSIYLANNQQYEGGTDIYKYTAANADSFTKPFITTPAGTEMYGKGLGYDSKTNQLVVTTVHTGYDYNDNDLIFYDAAAGTKLKDIAFTGNYFPAMPVFH
jgi:hypothetical protein